MLRVTTTEKILTRMVLNSPLIGIHAKSPNRIMKRA